MRNSQTVISEDTKQKKSQEKLNSQTQQVLALHSTDTLQRPLVLTECVYNFCLKAFKEPNTTEDQ